MRGNLGKIFEFFVISGLLLLAYFSLFNVLAPAVQSGANNFPTSFRDQAFIAESIPANWLIIQAGLLMVIILFKTFKFIVLLAMLAGLGVSLLYALHHYQFTLS
jgi:hypothetical protein